ncbi:hypothetical protein TBLA_0F02050 [Henningerozyma blattae CBS 6284]|uniref:Uncharacterized protein n=1 Tax=Henningerozyma blattae (strain ATCC 34711 / CBS 6284 / DSM 70876 / NBRC 10599 / NRRL Y-10934 / UCD 77-7) TaxID=1071380 RepID=I2H5U5_HENB6|nr:hypothetical protein TBLA_0F02050 [Tetrapisispora blattae CBS 6284]CCH61747.1 hypothetical protein TBLA_0F02050 [Tetrapisispora blattae CBS 6284]
MAEIPSLREIIKHKNEKKRTVSLPSHLRENRGGRFKPKNKNARFIQKMEGDMLRWGTHQNNNSFYGSKLAIEGKHPYQIDTSLILQEREKERERQKQQEKEKEKEREKNKENIQFFSLRNEEPGGLSMMYDPQSQSEESSVYTLELNFPSNPKRFKNFKQNSNNQANNSNEPIELQEITIDDEDFYSTLSNTHNVLHNCVIEDDSKNNNKPITDGLVVNEIENKNGTEIRQEDNDIYIAQPCRSAHHHDSNVMPNEMEVVNDTMDLNVDNPSNVNIEDYYRSYYHRSIPIEYVRMSENMRDGNTGIIMPNTIPQRGVQVLNPNDVIYNNNNNNNNSINHINGTQNNNKPFSSYFNWLTTLCCFTNETNLNEHAAQNPPNIDPNP